MDIKSLKVGLDKITEIEKIIERLKNCDATEKEKLIESAKEHLFYVRLIYRNILLETAEAQEISSRIQRNYNQNMAMLYGPPEVLRKRAKWNSSKEEDSTEEDSTDDTLKSLEEPFDK